MPCSWPLPALLRHVILGGAAFLVLLAQTVRSAGGDPVAGAQQFGACAACHSFEPGRNCIGPSLAGIPGRNAGTAGGFCRYWQTLKDSSTVWDEQTLDAWLTDPRAFLPGTRMVFRGVPDPQARADLIAYLAQAGPQGPAQQPDGMGMAGGELPDLKRIGAENRVTAIRHCADGYDVTTADGATATFWETNLRFKTDSSDRGPERGKPVIVGAGMVGDRASVIFAAPEEISAYIVPGC